MATLYKVNGTVVKDIKPKDPKSGFSLDELYKLIDTDIIQPIYHGSNANRQPFIFIGDEEGKLKPDAKVNWEATSLLHKRDRVAALSGTILVGNILEVNDEEFK